MNGTHPKIQDLWLAIATCTEATDSGSLDDVKAASKALTVAVREALREASMATYADCANKGLCDADRIVARLMGEEPPTP